MLDLVKTLNTVMHQSFVSPHRARDSGDTAGLKCQDFISDVPGL